MFTFNPTPGQAYEVCVDPSNLLLTGSTLLDALTFRWHFQGQTQDGFAACFEAPCDGEYTVTLEILLPDGTVCMALNSTYQHNVEANCQGKKDIQYKETFEYYHNGERSKVKFRAKHQTKYDNSIWFNWGKNQVETEQKSYKKKWYGWKKTPRRHQIFLDGNVYPTGNACLCDGAPFNLDPTFHFRDKTEKKTEYNVPLFLSEPGIFCKVDDPYEVTFIEDNGAVTQTYRFPQ